MNDNEFEQAVAYFARSLGVEPRPEPQRAEAGAGRVRRVHPYWESLAAGPRPDAPRLDEVDVAEYLGRTRGSAWEASR